MDAQPEGEQVIDEQVRFEQDRLIPFYNIPRWLAHIVRSPINTKKTETKTGLLQIIYVNPFLDLIMKIHILILPSFMSLSIPLEHLKRKKRSCS